MCKNLKERQKCRFHLGFPEKKIFMVFVLATLGPVVIEWHLLLRICDWNSYAISQVFECPCEKCWVQHSQFDSELLGHFWTKSCLFEKKIMFQKNYGQNIYQSTSIRLSYLRCCLFGLELSSF